MAISILLLAPPARGQTSLPREVTQQDRPLTEEQRTEVIRFVGQWVAVLADETADAKRIEDARQALGLKQPSNYPGGISAYFRTAYSEILTPRLTTVMQGTNTRAKIDALLIAARLGTDAGLNVLIEEIDNPSPVVRNAAAGRAILAIYDIQAGRSLVGPALVSNLARQAYRAAMAETSGYALQRQIELINSIQMAGRTNPATLGQLADEAHQQRKDVLGEQSKDLQAGEVDALTMLISTLRSYFQLLPQQSQIKEGKELAAHLRLLLKAAYEDWDMAHQTRPVHESYGRLIEDTESFLSFIDRSVAGTQTPNTEMRRYWRQQDKLQFERDLDLWYEHLRKEPYLINRR